MAKWLALATGLIGFALIGVLLLVPFATKDRVLFGTAPQPQPVASVGLVDLAGGQRACLDEAVVDERSEVAHIQIGTYGRRGEPVRLTLEGDGYRASARVEPDDYADSVSLPVPVRPPDRAIETTICVSNEGRRRIALYASNDRTKTRSATEVDGRPLEGTNFWVWFTEGAPVSLAERVGTIFDRIEAFRPGFVGNGVLWVLLVLVGLGVPLGTVLALTSALRDDEPRPRESWR